MFSITVEGVRFLNVQKDETCIQEFWFAPGNDFIVSVTPTEDMPLYAVGSHVFSSLFPALSKSVQLHQRKEELRNASRSSAFKPFVAD